MQLISIEPKNGWKWMFKQSMIMGLTHLVKKYPEYKEMAKNRPEGSFLILDNSIVELGESVTLQDILDAAKEVNADEIVLRDAYPNGPKTILRIKEDIEYLRKNNLTNKYQIMAVCHGESVEDFKATFDYINSVPEITTIGIPKVLCKWLPTKSRLELAEIFTKTDKQIHLLGSWYNLGEQIDFANSKYSNRIRSCDTCLPSLYVIQNKLIIEDRDGTIDLEKEYPELTKEKYNRVLEYYYNCIKTDY